MAKSNNPTISGLSSCRWNIPYKIFVVVIAMLLISTACNPPDPNESGNTRNITDNGNGLAGGNGIGDKIDALVAKFSDKNKTDDWELELPSNEYDSIGGRVMNAIGQGVVYKSTAPMASAGIQMEQGIGFSVGGAKDINNFRENIKNGFFPLETDLTYEGLYYDYYFDTGESKKCTKLFCPSYTTAVTKDPLSKTEGQYLSVGLNSGVQDFQRKKLNLVIVLDISGSMGSSFDSYYYDRFGRSNWNETDNEEDKGKSKMQVAAKSIVGLIDHLNPEDRFGMVLFDDQAYLAKPLNKVGSTDMQKIKDHVLELTPRGGTYMESGFKMGTSLFDKIENDKNYENRIIFLTDAMPNIGETNPDNLQGMFKKNAEKKIYTTFIGIGVDFNTQFVEETTKVRGANYYSVHSASEFAKRMDKEFEYMVTPMVFDLKLDVIADGYDIEKVYGSPEANEATGEIMKVNTLFPSAKTDEGTKGGIVLLKLRKTGENPSLKLRVSYEDRDGKKDSSEEMVVFDVKEHYSNFGIRKGILLSQYADLMKNWIQDERREREKPVIFVPGVDRIKGIVVPCLLEEQDTNRQGNKIRNPSIMPPRDPRCIGLTLGQWERQSVPLTVSEHYKGVFSEFERYFDSEMKLIGDDTLSKEKELLEKLSR